MRSRSSSSAQPRPRRASGVSLDRNNNRLSRQGRLVHNTTKHTNEGFFGLSENISRVEGLSSVERYYNVGNLVGKGNFSRVFFAIRKSDDKKCALKEIDKRQLQGKWFFVENEVELLMICRHPNIHGVIDAFKTSAKYFLVFEYAKNGDLFELIRERGHLAEDESAIITNQIALALQYLHSINVVHRDVKPENVLLFAGKRVKVCDFGLACTVLGPLYRVCGTPTYCAPEVLQEKGYGVSVDVWSLGVVLHVMLVGHAPFRSSDRIRLFRLISQAKLHFDLPHWSSISLGVRELLSSMLSPHPNKRITASQVIEHSWVQENKNDEE